MKSSIVCHFFAWISSRFLRPGPRIRNATKKVLQRCSAARVVPFGYGGCESCPAKAVDTVDIHRFVWFCLPNKFLISQFWLCCSIYIASKMPHSLNRTRLSWMQWFKVFDPNGSVCREKPTICGQRIVLDSFSRRTLRRLFWIRRHFLAAPVGLL